MAASVKSSDTAGRVEQVHPRVRRVLARNPSPFTFSGTQSYLVGDSDALALIDPGPDDADHVAALLAAIGSARLVAILCTHTHLDHSPAAPAIAATTGAPIVGCAPLALDDSGPRADASFDGGYAPDCVLGDGEAVTGAGWTLRAVATPGHTSNHLCFALDGEGVLFSGDHVMGWSTTVVSPPDGDMGDYMASLEKLLARDDRLYLPAHGPAVEEPARLVRGMLGHRRQREGQILRLAAERPHGISEFVARMYAGLDPRLHGAAGRSVLAHLIELERRGRVAPVGESWRATD